MHYLVWIQPTGRLHIGNYFGAIKPALDKATKGNNVTFLIAHYHAWCSYQEALDFEKNLSMVSNMKENNNIKIIIQDSHILEIFYFLSHNVSVSNLKRLPQYKTKEKTLHMLSYPLLMTCDIISSWCNAVIVWPDQIPHIQFYNDICKKFGYKKAEAIVTDIRIMSIKDPTKKMSKSLGDEHCIYLDDTPEDIHKKIMSAPTTKEGIDNLKNIAKLFGTTFDENQCKLSKENLIKIISNYNY